MRDCAWLQSVGSNIAKANWVPSGKERAWALMFIGLGEFCIKNDEFCIENDEFCIKNDDFVLRNYTLKECIISPHAVALR